jgi:hypothetical protein
VTQSLHAAIGCHRLLFLRDLHSSLAAIAVIDGHSLGIFTVILLTLLSSFTAKMTVLPPG